MEQSNYRQHIRLIPKLGDIKFTDFHKSKEIVASGQKAVEAKIDEIKKIVNNKHSDRYIAP